MSEANKAIIRRYYEEIVNRGNLSFADEVYSYDAELHIPGLVEDPYGPGPVKQLYAAIRSAFPGTSMTIEDIVAEQDRVVARVTFRGPHQAGAQGPPTSGLVTWSRIDIFRLFQGKIVEQWADRDDLGLMHQYGVNLPSAS